MTPPGKLPPPGKIPAPVPMPPAFQPPPYVETELTDFEDMPTKVEHVCPGCQDPQLALPEDAQPPDSFGDAWHGRHGAACRGTSAWWWCCKSTWQEVRGRLELPHQGITATFRDRRHAHVAVDVDRRRPPRR